MPPQHPAVTIFTIIATLRCIHTMSSLKACTTMNTATMLHHGNRHVCHSEKKRIDITMGDWTSAKPRAGQMQNAFCVGMQHLPRHKLVQRANTESVLHLASSTEPGPLGKHPASSAGIAAPLAVVDFNACMTQAHLANHVQQIRS